MIKALTFQQIFNKVGKHLLTQLEQSRQTNPNDPAFAGRCLYRTHTGLKCAIGCLIPDDIYDIDMENNSAGHLLTRWTIPGLHHQGYESRLSFFLNKLQTIHDDSGREFDPDYNKEAWSRELRMLANKYDLSTRWISPLMHKD